MRGFEEAREVGVRLAEITTLAAEGLRVVSDECARRIIGRRCYQVCVHLDEDGIRLRVLRTVIRRPLRKCPLGDALLNGIAGHACAVARPHSIAIDADLIVDLVQTGQNALRACSASLFTACLTSRKCDCSPPPGVLGDAGPVAIELVQHLLRGDQFDIPTLGEIFERADDRLIANVLCKVKPDAGIDRKPECHAVPLSVGNPTILLKAGMLPALARQGELRAPVPPDGSGAW